MNMYAFDNNREQNDWNGFVLLSPVETFSSGYITETRIPLFDISAKNGDEMKIIWQTADGAGNTDMSDIIVSLTGDHQVILDLIDSLQRVGSVPSEDWLIIDGYFDDWKNIERYKDIEEAAANPNVDIDEYAGVSQGTDSFFYLSVEGNILAGITIPSSTAKAKPSADSNSNSIDIIDPTSDTT